MLHILYTGIKCFSFHPSCFSDTQIRVSKPKLFCRLVSHLYFIKNEGGKEKHVSNTLTKEDLGGREDVLKICHESINMKLMSLLPEKKKTCCRS